MKTIFKTFTKTIVTGFLCATVICGSVLGDVFEARCANGNPVTVAPTPDEFADWVKLHPNMEGLQNNFIEAAGQLQMPGFAVFFPEGSSEPQQVYVAMKRQYQDGRQFLADNNPEKAGGHVLNYSSNMHTERQLAIVALEEAILKTTNPTATLLIAGEDYNDTEIGPLLAGAKVPKNRNELPQLRSDGTYDLAGKLYIFTKLSPCATSGLDNNRFTCFDYYRALAKYFPNVSFHICFPIGQLKLTAEQINNYPQSRGNLLEAAIPLMSSEKLPDDVAKKLVRVINSFLIREISGLQAEGDQTEGDQSKIKDLLNIFERVQATANPDGKKPDNITYHVFPSSEIRGGSRC